MIKVSDYIVDFLIRKGIKHAFGFPGGMVMHLIASLETRKGEIILHENYHEQASAFCACGYAQIMGEPGFAYATSGPGATNLMTGVANAYFDSIPCIFITGQINTYEAKGSLNVRQKGFQEMEVAELFRPITKYSAIVNNPEKIGYELEKAYRLAVSGRPGPVVLDIPMDIQRTIIDEEKIETYRETQDAENSNADDVVETCLMELKKAEKPIVISGNGINISNSRDLFRDVAKKLRIPVISSMIAVDVLESTTDINFGFLGAYGNRIANYLTANCDLIISIGSRLDTRQTGVKTEWFAPQAKLIRIDIDSDELGNTINKNESKCKIDINSFLSKLKAKTADYERIDAHERWLNDANKARDVLAGYDGEPANALISEISSYVPKDAVITADVGQNEVWVAQSFKVKGEQRVLFSGGHGAMGYSLPAAIGACLASGKPTFCFTGDGGLQMNIQELQFLVREQLPITIILLNNKSLGMMRHFQEMYFDSNYVQTKAEGGYLTPNFKAIAGAYGIQYINISTEKDIKKISNGFSGKPLFVEVSLADNTYLFPKLAVNMPIHIQEPRLSAEIKEKAEELLNGER